ncbi:hypothetical protein WJX84_007563 [Apatococcus fuscideae]|uniref:Enoyl reductase (ER) domain-containing protein n=1 Tax=Apatococcus fuscideae TaxID=2026836 RepID=A0AAW1TFM4_9CHLO
MRACQYSRTGDSTVLNVVEVAAPLRAKGEVIVEIVAAGVNPLDVKVRKGEFFPIAQRLPKIPGCDIAGYVQEAAPGSQFKKGDRVWGMLETGFCWVKTGTHAEMIAAPEKALALIPKEVSFEEAAATASVAITAWQALDVDRLRAGQRVLIHAGSGGIGHIAIQLAKNAGTHVITTASTGNTRFVQEVGADEVIDYTCADFVKELKNRPVDVVVDSLGGDYTARSRAVLKKSGRYAHIMANGWSRLGYGILMSFLLEVWQILQGLIVGLLGMGPKHQPVGASPNPQQLNRIGALMASGKVKVHIDKTFPLEQARAAHEYQEKGRPRGKILITMK